MLDSNDRRLDFGSGSRDKAKEHDLQIEEVEAGDPRSLEIGRRAADLAWSSLVVGAIKSYGGDETNYLKAASIVSRNVGGTGVALIEHGADAVEAVDPSMWPIIGRILVAASNELAVRISSPRDALEIVQAALAGESTRDFVVGGGNDDGSGDKPGSDFDASNN